jgi:hypothetical protein
MKHKPTFILLDKETSEGMNLLHRFFVEKKGFDIDLLRTLVVKYPYILGKNEEHLTSFF